MSFVSEPARISLLAGSNATSCELCTAQTVAPTTSVVITHLRGAIVQFGACDWCVQAIRRLAAASGGHAAFAVSEAAGAPPSALRQAPREPRRVPPGVLINELAEELQDSAGIHYVVRVLGRERVDGTWEGFLKFGAVGGSVRSERERKLRRVSARIWPTGRRG